MIITKETDYALRILRVLLDGEKHSIYREASIHAGLRNSTVSPKAIVENKNVLKIIFGKAF